ncbi:MAG: ABC transporter permease [Verrucomicrobiales bacterium]|nr:ABC transporter permease [Verrucomicrobiales bacterium]
MRFSGVALGAGLGWAWLAVLVFLPLMLVVGAGFLTRGDYGGIQGPLTGENYRRLAGWGELGWEPLYPRVLLRTLTVATVVVVATAAASIPLAFFMASRGPRGRALALGLLVVPFWTNLLIRTYAWQVLLGAGGPLASWAVAWGWLPAGGALYPGWFAVGLVMFCDFLPFMALPVYASVERVDWTQVDAAADLGAAGPAVFRHALWPQIRPGVGAGVAMVFLPAMGQFVIPELLGGGQVTLLGSLIQQQFGASRDWPFGSAAATVTLLGLLLSAGWTRRGRSRSRQPGRGG